MKTYKVIISGKEIDIIQNDDGSFNKPNIVKELEPIGTALKPAFEPICMAMKPLSEKNYVSNVLKYGTGGINIDESRVEMTQQDKDEVKAKANKKDTTNNIIKGFGNNTSQFGDWDMKKGRFPANLIHDNSEEVRECFPETGQPCGSVKKTTHKDGMFGIGQPGVIYTEQDGDNRSASRFFKSIIYTAKASKSERNKGCEGLEEKETKRYGDFEGTEEHAPKLNVKNTNNHPTVKPIALMEYLINMITREGQTVLDPFAGSGTTLIAAKKLGRKYIGIELEPEYVKIAEARLSSVPERLL